MAFINNNISIDTILNGKVIIKQFKFGYRIGIDTILLASMVTSNKPISVLDLGAGVGGISLCILYRLKNVRVVSVEKVSSYYNLCLENLHLNKYAVNRYTPLLGDISDFKELFNQFDIVVSNPPYYKKGEVQSSSSSLKNVANIESTANLQSFVDLSYKYLKPKGKLFIIQKTPRIIDIINNINLNSWGSITLYPIYSYSSNNNADRCILSMKKLSKEGFRITRGLVIHKEDTSYTKKALDIIFNGSSFF